jgi:hypothetical protein
MANSEGAVCLPCFSIGMFGAQCCASRMFFVCVPLPKVPSNFDHLLAPLLTRAPFQTASTLLCLLYRVSSAALTCSSPFLCSRNLVKTGTMLAVVAATPLHSLLTPHHGAGTTTITPTGSAQFSRLRVHPSMSLRVLGLLGNMPPPCRSASTSC